MADSFEDRMFLAGKHGIFSAAVNKFRKSRKSRGDQQNLYDKLFQMGASPEEADEFVDMECECSE